MPWDVYPPGYSGAPDGNSSITSTPASAALTLSADYLSLTPIWDLPAGFSGEGAAHGMLNSIAASYPDHSMLTFSGGVGGMPIAALDKPTAAEIALLPATATERKIAAAGQTLASLTDYSIFDCGTYYYMFMWLLSRSAKLIRDQGKRPIVSALVWQQGEADVDNSAIYPLLFTQLCTDLVADIKAITGQSDLVVILAETIDSSTTLEAPGQAGYDTWVDSGYTDLTGYRNEANRINDLFAWDIQHAKNVIASRYASPSRDVYLVAPRYPHTSRGHLHPHAARAHGEQFGKVYRRVVIEGQPWEHVSPVNWWISGAKIFVRFSVPRSPLQFAIPPQGDTHVINAAIPYGFEHSAGAITQANAWIAEPDLICIEPDVLPAVGQTLSYCKSARYGSLCDSDATRALYTDKTGIPNVMRNYCVPFSITL